MARRIAARFLMANPDPHDRLLSITELADELGMTPRAIRFYESKGLIEPQRAGGNRVYTYRDRARLLLILRGKRLGFSLAEVKEYLDLYDVDRTRHEQMVHLLRGTRQRLAELEEQRRDLELTIEELRDVERQTLEAMAAQGLVVPPAPDVRIGSNGRATSPATPSAAIGRADRAPKPGAPLDPPRGAKS